MADAIPASGSAPAPAAPSSEQPAVPARLPDPRDEKPVDRETSKGIRVVNN